jgi:hypothetical protein
MSPAASAHLRALRRPPPLSAALRRSPPLSRPLRPPTIPAATPLDPQATHSILRDHGPAEITEDGQDDHPPNARDLDLSMIAEPSRPTAVPVAAIRSSAITIEATIAEPSRDSVKSLPGPSRPTQALPPLRLPPKGQHPAPRPPGIPTAPHRAPTMARRGRPGPRNGTTWWFVRATAAPQRHDGGSRLRASRAEPSRVGPTGRPADRPTGRPADRATGLPGYRATGQPGYRATGQPGNRATRG